MSEHANELKDRFADAAIALLLDQYAQEEGDALLRRFHEDSEEMPEQLDRRCQSTIHCVCRRTRIRSACKSVARSAACAAAVLCLVFSLAMNVEAFRVPAINFILKNGKGLTQITFSQNKDSFSALDQLRMFIFQAIPDDYEFQQEKIGTDTFGGTETVTSLLIRYQGQEDAVVDILVTKAAGAINFGDEEVTVKSMDLYGQNAIFTAEDQELRVLWINDVQEQLYIVTGYGSEPDAFWKCVHTLAESTQKAGYDIRF